MGLGRVGLVHGVEEFSLFIPWRNLGETGVSSCLCVWETSSEEPLRPAFSLWNVRLCRAPFIGMNDFNRPGVTEGLGLQ